MYSTPAMWAYILTCNKVLDFLRGHLDIGFEHDVGFGQFTSVSVGHTDHCRVSDLRVGQQQRFQLSWGNLRLYN